MSNKQPRSTSRPDIDQQGRTPLHYAAADGSSDEVKRLLVSGAAVDAQDSNGWSPLHFAAQAVSPECTIELLKAGADVTLQDSFGNTALFRAVFASGGNGSVIQLLRKAGANPRSGNHHGVSPLSLARTIASHDVARFFSDLSD